MSQCPGGVINGETPAALSLTKTNASARSRTEPGIASQRSAGSTTWSSSLLCGRLHPQLSWRGIHVSVWHPPTPASFQSSSKCMQSCCHTVTSNLDAVRHKSKLSRVLWCNTEMFAPLPPVFPPLTCNDEVPAQEMSNWPAIAYAVLEPSLSPQ